MAINLEQWKMCGLVPKQEIVFLSQVILIYTIVAVSIINLSIGNGDTNLWCVLISFSAGSLLPSPYPHKDRNKKIKAIIPLNTEENGSLSTETEIAV